MKKNYKFIILLLFLTCGLFQPAITLAYEGGKGKYGKSKIINNETTVDSEQTEAENANETNAEDIENSNVETTRREQIIPSGLIQGCETLCRNSPASRYGGGILNSVGSCDNLCGSGLNGIPATNFIPGQTCCCIETQWLNQIRNSCSRTGTSLGANQFLVNNSNTGATTQFNNTANGNSAQSQAEVYINLCIQGCKRINGGTGGGVLFNRSIIPSANCNNLCNSGINGTAINGTAPPPPGYLCCCLQTDDAANSVTNSCKNSGASGVGGNQFRFREENAE